MRDQMPINGRHRILESNRIGPDGVETASILNGSARASQPAILDLHVNVMDDNVFVAPQIADLAAAAPAAAIDPVVPSPQTGGTGSGSVALTSLGTAFTQNFDSLGNPGGTATALGLTGWYVHENGTGGAADGNYVGGTGSGNGGNLYSFGVAGTNAVTDRALGSLTSAAVSPNYIGAQLSNSTGATITSLLISYVGEQWRLGAADGNIDKLDFQYSLNATSLIDGAATWTDVNGLDFTAPFNTTVGTLDGNAAANRTALSSTISGLTLANGQTIWIRWIDSQVSGANDGLAIDDFSITASGSAPLPNLSISDVTLAEGNGGTTSFTFTVNLSAASATDVTFDIATANGSATTADNDYVARALSGQVITAGQTSYTFTVDVNGDTAVELVENFFVNVTNVTGANVVDGQGQGTISNDDGVTISINNPTVTEGNSGTTTLTYTVTLSGPAPVGGVTFDIATADGTATLADNDYVARSLTGVTIAEGDTSYTFDVTVNGDTRSESPETVLVNITNPSSNAIVAVGQGVGTIATDDFTLIHDIQGTSYFSPLLRNAGVSTFNTASSFTVVVQAVVTAIDNNGNRQGFFITEETGEWDANPFTSEGIFVMTRTDAGVGTAVSGVQVGDIVTITANIMEYQGFATNLPMTVLTNAAITVTGNTPTLPTLLLDASRPIPNDILSAVTPDYTDSVDDPGDTFDATNYAMSYFETIEGMLVTVPDLRVADGLITTSGGEPYFKAYSAVHGDASQINTRGGYTIAGGNVNYGGQTLTDGDINPDILEVDFSGYGGISPYTNALLSMGDRLGALTGIIESDFTEMKLYVTDATGAAFVDTTLTRESTTLTPTSRQLSFATFNVENLKPADANPSSQFAAGKFAAIAELIKNNLKLPDILSIEEIQDNNGAAVGDGTSGTGTDASTTWQLLVDALNAATGAHYQWVDQAPVYNAEGGEQSGNIRVGFLYNTDRVQLGDLAANASLADRRKYVDRLGDGVRDAGDLIQFSDDMLAPGTISTADWAGTRKSLLGQFSFNGQTVFALANHLPSKGGSGEFWQFNQTRPGQPANSDWAQRNAVGEDIYSMLNHIQTNSANARLLAGGDFNEFYFYRGMEAATGFVYADGTARNDGTRLVNLTLNLPEAERYSYTFDGRAQQIDYILSDAASAAVSQYDIVHLNSGFASTNRLSDHDPILATFDYSGFAEVLGGTAGADTINGMGGDDVLNGLGGNDILISGTGNDTLNGGEGDDGLYFGAAYTSADTVNGGAGALDQLGLRGDYSGGTTLGAMTGIEQLVLLSGQFITYEGSETDRFSYNLSVTDATLAAGQRLAITANTLLSNENFTFNGAAELDGSFVTFGGNGIDILTGGQQDDGFYFGRDRWGGSDVVNGQGGALDQLGLQGNYSGGSAIVFGVNQIVGIEQIVLLSGADGRFGGPGTGFSYNLTLNDANVLVGTTFAITANMLASNESLTLNASAESDVGISVFGGAGNDVLLLGAQGDTVFGGAGNDAINGNGGNDRLTGGAGADTLTGGTGADTFVYLAVSDSTAAERDTITDFTTGDLVDLTAIDANTTNGTADSFVFIGGNSFSAAGQLRATLVSGQDWLVEGDTNGDGAADFSLLMTSDHTLTAADFLGAVSQAGIEPLAISKSAIAEVIVADALAPSNRFGIELFAKESLPLMVHIDDGRDMLGVAMDPLASHDFIY